MEVQTGNHCMIGDVDPEPEMRAEVVVVLVVRVVARLAEVKLIVLIVYDIPVRYCRLDICRYA